MEASSRNTVVSVVMIIVGAIVAAVTVIGLISSLVNSSGKPANSSAPRISYGSVTK